MRQISFSMVVLIMSLVVVVQAPPASAQVEKPEQLPSPSQTPTESVCPSPFPAPIFLPADEVLRQADLIQPPTPDGWIVTNRPVLACGSGAEDPAGRAFRDYEYPLRLRQYESQVRLIQLEIENLAERQSVYRYFNKTGVLMVEVQNTNYAILAAEERLRNLRYERMLYLRHHQRELSLARHGWIVSQETRPEAVTMALGLGKWPLVA